MTREEIESFIEDRESEGDDEETVLGTFCMMAHHGLITEGQLREIGEIMGYDPL